MFQYQNPTSELCNRVIVHISSVMTIGLYIYKFYILVHKASDPFIKNKFDFAELVDEQLKNVWYFC